jgi:hypothetical protein
MFRLLESGRSSIGLLAGLSLFVAGALSAAAAPPNLSAYHQPPWLVTPGRQLAISYGLLPDGATGTLYVRNDLERSFTQLHLVPGTYCPGDPVDAAALRRDKLCGKALVGQVPGRIVAGSRLYYYAVLHDGARTTTVPSGGAARPQRIWVIRHPIDVSLGTHRFGHPRAPGSIVAHAGPKQVGLSCCADPPGGDGPSSFDIARDGSIWVLDRLNERLLVWPGRTSGAARSIQLPKGLEADDLALGADGTVYVRATDTGDLSRARDKSHLYALTGAGKVRWTAPRPLGIPTDQLQMGPDGVLYAALACGETCAPFGGNVAWMPLTTPTGRPLSLTERALRASPFEPLPGGLRLVSELSYTVARFALIDHDDQVVRAWRVTSRTQLGGMRAAPALAGGELVVPLDVSAGAQWEQVVLQLDASGGTQLSLAGRTVLGGGLLSPLRIGRDGRLYQLRTDIRTGVTIAAYSLGSS